MTRLEVQKIEEQGRPIQEFRGMTQLFVRTGVGISNFCRWTGHLVASAFLKRIPWHVLALLLVVVFVLLALFRKSLFVDPVVQSIIKKGRDEGEVEEEKE